MFQNCIPNYIMTFRGLKLGITVFVQWRQLEMTLRIIIFFNILPIQDSVVIGIVCTFLKQI